MEPTPQQIEPAEIQYIEPTFLFKTARMVIGEDNAPNEVIVTELVHKDQKLIEFSRNTAIKEGVTEQRPIQLADSCYASEDGNTIYSAITGYPKIIHLRLKEFKTFVLHITVEPLFRISPDKMKASIAIHPPLTTGNSLAKEDLSKLLESEGITSGLQPDTLAQAETLARQGLCEFNILPIAIGTQPVHGTDAYLKFEIETGPIPGKILKDGTIDFRERKIFVPVRKNQIIAVKIPATTGTSGKTVLGERVPPNPGRDIAVNTLKDATYSIRSRKVTATADGVLSVIGDTIIKVCSRQEIMSDIDYCTGHIESRNSVLIHGSVHPSFKVITDGDLEIRGSVMSTNITSKANIVIKSGITGKNSTVTAQGDVDIYFVEQGKIQSGGNCIIRKQSYYSKVVAGGNIRCPEKSVVVGGELVAAGSLSLGNIGSANSTPAFIAAGVDGDRLDEYTQLQRTLSERQEALIQWLQLHKGTVKAKKIAKMEHAVESIRSKLMRINLIPGSGMYSNPNGNKQEFFDRRISEDSLTDISEISIEIYGIVFAGTKIQIGNKKMILEHTIAHRLFKLNNTLSEIAAFPLKRR